MFALRFLTALVGLPIVFVALWFGAVPWAFLVLTAGVIGLFEYFDMVERMGFVPRKFIGGVLGVLVLLAMWLAKPAPFLPTASGLLALSLGVLMVYETLRAELKVAFPSLCVTFFGVMYVSWMLGHLILLREIPVSGRQWTLFLFVCVWVMDSAAYAIGIPFGRNRLASVISPKKTVEGAVASVVAAIVVAVGFSASKAIPVTLLQAATLGLWISMTGQLGDLAESLIKRSCGVKDSGQLFPGHGGILDKLDSFLFAAPACYYWVKMMSR